jgi:polysaccharide export outer membrane protein
MLNLRLTHLARGAVRTVVAAMSALLMIAMPLVPAHAQAAAAATSKPAPTRAADPDQSRIGPGDSIRITVYQSPDLSMETRVNETGAISYPLLGRVQLAGLSVTAAEQHIASELKRREFVKDPQVQIVVTQVRANQVNVLGQVGKPGRYPLDLTGMRLTEVLALAGGIVAGVGSDNVVVTGSRNGTPFRKDVDMPRLFQAGNGSEDIVIAPGDSIFVDRAPQIYLYGEIQHPGALRLERGMTVMQAIAAGGGATPRGTLRGLKVTRTGADGKQTQLEPAMEDQLKNGDVVYVKESLF